MEFIYQNGPKMSKVFMWVRCILNIGLTNTQTNAMKAGRYVYDVEITSSGGTKTRVLEGQIEITPGVTTI